MAWLLDTNVLSELRRPRPEPKVVAFVAGQPLDELWVSAVTLAELRYGIELVAEPNRRAELADWLMRRVRPMFEEPETAGLRGAPRARGLHESRILPLSEEVMLKWRLLVEEGRQAGHAFSQPDLMIAATAAQHGLIVVTRDRREYDRARVAVLNPWDQA